MKRTLAALSLLLLSACPMAPGPTGSGLTPASKGDRLTPTSKGERRGDGTVAGRLLMPPGLLSVRQLASVPVPGARVQIEGTDLQSITDADGRFVIQNAPVGQDFSLVAEKTDVEGKRFRARTVGQVPVGHVSFNLEALLLQETGSVSGKVTLADAKAPEAIDVYLPGTTLVAKTDAEGNFALPDIPAGEYRLSAYKAGYAPVQSAPLQIRAGKVTLATLPELRAEAAVSTAGFATLTGRISNAGKALAGTQVALIGNSLTEARVALTNAEGEYLIGRIMPDQAYEIVVMRPFFIPVFEKVSLKAGETLRRDLELDFERLTLGRLQVEVRDCVGAPVASALIQLDPAPALGPVPFTDSRGLLQLGQLLPGPYTVHAAKGDNTSFTGILIDNLPTGPDQKPGALAKARLVLGDCQPKAE